jgi:hypothetical protein
MCRWLAEWVGCDWCVQPLTRAAGKYVLRMLLCGVSVAEVTARALLLTSDASPLRSGLGALVMLLLVESTHHLNTAVLQRLPPVIRRLSEPATFGLKLVRAGERPPRPATGKG